MYCMHWGLRCEATFPLKIKGRHGQQMSPELLNKEFLKKSKQCIPISWKCGKKLNGRCITPHTAIYTHTLSHTKRRYVVNECTTLGCYFIHSGLPFVNCMVHCGRPKPDPVGGRSWASSITGICTLSMHMHSQQIPWYPCTYCTKLGFRRKSSNIILGG